jgi:hypothetical protein
MEFTVELRYQTGASTILSTEASTADQALERSRDHKRDLVSIRISAQATEDARVEAAPRSDEGERAGYRRIPAHHRRSRRH